MLPPGWHGPGRPYDPSSNPFAGPPPPAPTVVADWLDQDIKRFRAKLEDVKCLNNKTLYLFSVYMVTDMASGTADLLRFGDGMAAGGVEGISQDLGRFGGIVLAVACPASRCCKAPGAVITEGLPSSRGTFYYGGFDPKTGRVYLGSDGHFGGMAQAGGKPASTMPGISVRQTPDGVFWSNDSISLRGALTPEEAAKVQQALQSQFKCPVRQVDDIYNP